MHQTRSPQKRSGSQVDVDNKAAPLLLDLVTCNIAYGLAVVLHLNLPINAYALATTSSFLLLLSWADLAANDDVSRAAMAKIREDVAEYLRWGSWLAFAYSLAVIPSYPWLSMSLRCSVVLFICMAYASTWQSDEAKTSSQRKRQSTDRPYAWPWAPTLDMIEESRARWCMVRDTSQHNDRPDYEDLHEHSLSLR